MEPEDNDFDLLLRYAQTSNQPAFATLVRRHVDWVSSMAARLVHDRSLAEDVTQSVFLLLERRAGSLTRQSALEA
jgi:DNA-directed RNA polymerase specialized sigma24 family protein